MKQDIKNINTILLFTFTRCSNNVNQKVLSNHKEPSSKIKKANKHSFTGEDVIKFYSKTLAITGDVEFPLNFTVYSLKKMNVVALYSLNMVCQSCAKVNQIVSNNAKYEKFGLEVIPDLIKDKGPPGGIHAALRHTNSEKIFIVSCGMPNITTDAIQYMIERSSKSQITLPVNNGKTEPLFGVYSKKCLPLWQQLIEQGMIKLQMMITHFDLLKINVGDNELFSDSLFLNINDKNDFQKALKQLQDGN